MKVCFLTPEYPPGPAGGIGTSTAVLAKGLVAAGHEVHVVGPGPSLELDDDGVQVRLEPVAHPPRLGWLVVRRRLQERLRRLVAERGVDVVVAPDWTGLSAGIDPGCPVVVHCHGSATYFGDELGEPVRWSVRTAERRAVRGAAAVTSVSRHVAERTASLLGRRDQIVVVPNAVPPGSEPTAPTSRDPGTVLHVGTLVRKKGVLDVGRAFRAVHADRPDVRLELVGPDAADRATDQPSTWAVLRAELGAAADASTWHGRVAPDRLDEWYRRATILLVPSHAEAQPMVWLEGMAAGLPLVAFDHPWAREVVDPDRTGVLVPPGDERALADALASLLSDPDRRARLGAAAAAEVRRRFAPSAVVPQAEAVLADAVDRARAGAR